MKETILLFTNGGVCMREYVTFANLKNKYN